MSGTHGERQGPGDAYSLLPYSAEQLRRGLTDAADAGFGGVELVDEHLPGLDALGGTAAFYRLAQDVGVAVVATGIGVLPSSESELRLAAASGTGVGGRLSGEQDSG